MQAVSEYNFLYGYLCICFNLKLLNDCIPFEPDYQSIIWRRYSHNTVSGNNVLLSLRQYISVAVFYRNFFCIYKSREWFFPEIPIILGVIASDGNKLLTAYIAYVIIPEEAEIVRKMFALYLDGVSLKDICAELNGAGYRTINGCLFQEASLHKMIKNEVYAGDILRQKCHIPDPISKKKVRNLGELPMYYQTDAHEAIIDRETYARVQAEIRRRESLVHPNYPFTGKITCGICGAHFTRKKSVYNGKCSVRWICRSKKEVGQTCTNINILEEQLESAAAAILGEDVFDTEQFEKQVRAMTIQKDGNIEFLLTNGRIALWEKE